MKNYNDLLNEVIRKNLCCYCGTCVGICPEEAIELSLNNLKEINKCIDCELCYKNCPGIGFDYSYYNNEIFKTSLNLVDPDLGFYRKIYTGYSKDKRIREASSSGGITTSILVGLLEEGAIDGGVVVGSRNKNALDSDVFIAKNKESIIRACQSKYITIPNNKILTELKKMEGRYAFVGLPCQIQGLRKAEENSPWLRSKILLYIGLFCGFNLYPSGTDFLLKKLKINKDNIIQLEYRGGKNTTGFRVKCKNGKEYFIKKHAYTFLNMMFTPKRCWKCYDLTSEFSDISIGDAWERTDHGWSRIITRTDRGEKVISNLFDRGYIQVEDSSKDDIIRSQDHLIKYKKKWFWSRYKIFKNKPLYNLGKIPKLTIKDKIIGNLFFFTQVVASSLVFRKIANLVPLKILTNCSEWLRNVLRGRVDSKK